MSKYVDNMHKIFNKICKIICKKYDKYASKYDKYAMVSIMENMQENIKNMLNMQEECMKYAS